jgi:hypothetical protein
MTDLPSLNVILEKQVKSSPTLRSQQQDKEIFFQAHYNPSYRRFHPPFFLLNVPTLVLSSLCSNLFPFCAPTLSFLTLSFLSNKLFSPSFFVSPSFLSSVLQPLSFPLCYNPLPLFSVFQPLSFIVCVPTSFLFSLCSAAFLS